MLIAAAFVITLAVVFLIKWVNAPVKLYYELEDKSATEIAALVRCYPHTPG
jgi:hypothetical protein